MTTILVFSGTTEGRSISEWLASEGMEVHVRVATDYGAAVMDPDGRADVAVGSCGGPEGIAKEIGRLKADLVIDATHPYASRITEHIREGCSAAGAELMRIIRNESDVSGDVIAVDSVKEAVEYLKTVEGTVLAATGSKEIDLYTELPGYRDRVVARVLSTMESMERCVGLGFEGRNLICAQGPFSEEVNYATLKQIGASYIVTKDSGSAGGFDAKLRAARRAGAKVVLVRRPDDSGISYDEAVGMLCRRFGLKAPSRGGRETARTVSLIGIGMGPGDLTQRASDVVASSDLLIGARRMLESADASGKAVLEEYRADRIASFLESDGTWRNAAVLLSGDVGFYSGALKLLDALKGRGFDVNVEPGISSVVHMCAKMGVPWQDACLASAHGRESNLINLICTNPKVFALLSGDESVHSLCRDLTEYGLNDVVVSIGQDFGYPTERIVSGRPCELDGIRFGDLCVALVCNPCPDQRNPIGIRDEDFIRGDAPMTKSEVRSLSVAKLKLTPDSVVYDVGAGTGSVSIEMALTAFRGKVYAIEKEDAAADLIEVNKKRFRTPNVEVVRGLAPEALSELPAPTHAFIGGSSGNLKEIVRCLLDKNPDVRMVVNSVTLETMSETMDVCRDLGLTDEEVVLVNISKARKAGRYHLMTAQNPVYIAVVRK